MNTIISLIAFTGTIISLGMVVYITSSIIKVNQMKRINKGLNKYVKKKQFLLIKNGGDDPCDTKERFYMPIFSQDCDYIIRRIKHDSSNR